MNGNVIEAAHRFGRIACDRSMRSATRVRVPRTSPLPRLSETASEDVIERARTPISGRREGDD